MTNYIYGALAILIIGLGVTTYVMSEKISAKNAEIARQNSELISAHQAMKQQKDLIDDIYAKYEIVYQEFDKLQTNLSNIDQRAVERDKEIEIVISNSPNVETKVTEEQLNANLEKMFNNLAGASK